MRYKFIQPNKPWIGQTFVMDPDFSDDNLEDAIIGNDLIEYMELDDYEMNYNINESTGIITILATHSVDSKRHMKILGHIIPEESFLFNRDILSGVVYKLIHNNVSLRRSKSRLAQLLIDTRLEYL